MKKFIVRFLATIGFLSLLPVILLLIIKVFNINVGPTIKSNTILTLDTSQDYPEHASGSLIKQALGKRELTFLQLISGIHKAKKDDRIKGLILRTDEVALGFGQMEELRAALQDFRTSGKFILAYANSFGEMAAGTKSLYLASNANKIMMQPFSHVTLTGFHIDQPFLKNALTKLGIEPQILTRKEYKNAFAFLTDERFSEAHRQAMQSLLEDIFTTMTQSIAKGRELDPELLHQATVNEIFISDSSAQEKGLIDALGYIDEVRTTALKMAGLEDAQFEAIDMYITLAAAEKNPSTTDSKVALIYGLGAIQEGGRDERDLLNDELILSAEETRQAFDEALEDPKVKTILLRLDTPGGSAVASETVRRSVLQAQAKGVPVIVSVGNVSASGGYWIMSPAHRIFADAMTITGSIGVIMGKMNFKKALENFDINVDQLSVGENGSLSSPLSAYSETQLEHLNRTLDLLYFRFKKIVSEGRKLNIDHVSEIAKGRVWSGIQAKKFGLVDQIGGIWDALTYIKQNLGLNPDDAITVQVFPAPKSTLQALRDALGTKPAVMVGLAKLNQWITKLTASGSTKANLQADIPEF
jgi:signal peptide peptidase SppA, 67K type